MATIPGAIAGKLLEHSAEDYFREHIVLIAGALILVALLMWLGEKVGKLEKPLTRVTARRFANHRRRPGFCPDSRASPAPARPSRPACSRDITREAAVRFSFLLSTPLIAGAALLKAL
jgi:undecaprenyl-diphosphatase